MQPSFDELHSLPVADKLQLVERLWDDIAASDEPLPLPAWHEEEARRRAAELEANPETALTREELWDRCEYPLSSPSRSARR